MATKRVCDRCGAEINPVNFMGVCLKIYSTGNAHPEAWQPRRPEDFCSYGERKDDKHEH